MFDKISLLEAIICKLPNIISSYKFEINNLTEEELNELNLLGETYLSSAIRADNIALVQIFISKGARMDILTYEKENILKIVDRNNSEPMKYLIYTNYLLKAINGENLESVIKNSHYIDAILIIETYQQSLHSNELNDLKRFAIFFLISKALTHSILNENEKNKCRNFLSELSESHKPNKQSYLNNDSYIGKFILNESIDIGYKNVFNNLKEEKNIDHEILFYKFICNSSLDIAVKILNICIASITKHIDLNLYTFDDLLIQFKNFIVLINNNMPFSNYLSKGELTDLLKESIPDDSKDNKSKKASCFKQRIQEEISGSLSI